MSSFFSGWFTPKPKTELEIYLEKINPLIDQKEQELVNARLSLESTEIELSQTYTEIGYENEAKLSKMKCNIKRLNIELLNLKIQKYEVLVTANPRDEYLQFYLDDYKELKEKEERPEPRKEGYFRTIIPRTDGKSRWHVMPELRTTSSAASTSSSAASTSSSAASTSTSASASPKQYFLAILNQEFANNGYKGVERKYNELKMGITNHTEQTGLKRAYDAILHADLFEDEECDFSEGGSKKRRSQRKKKSLRKKSLRKKSLRKKSLRKKSLRK